MLSKSDTSRSNKSISLVEEVERACEGSGWAAPHIVEHEGGYASIRVDNLEDGKAYKGSSREKAAWKLISDAKGWGNTYSSDLTWLEIRSNEGISLRRPAESTSDATTSSKKRKKSHDNSIDGNSDVKIQGWALLFSKSHSVNQESEKLVADFVPPASVMPSEKDQAAQLEHAQKPKKRKKSKNPGSDEEDKDDDEIGAFSQPRVLAEYVKRLQS